MFDFLAGISPFWWFAFAFLLGAIEMLSVTTLLLWPAIGALLVGVALFAVPDLSGSSQVLFFAVFSVILAVVGRWIFNKIVKRTRSRSGPALNSPAERAVGRHAKVLQGSGVQLRVVVDGIRWDAKPADGQKFKTGDLVIVRSAEGSTLHVAPVESD